ncbi:MAG: glycerophosphodiester phosphodiesterase [Actinobacteria bacterium]|nr:glycerophosphodiester phosphodiesterase [Thermoleophilia bacterium]MCB9012183.1 glycerophosphodiester phosphodiesterase [Actinomycetota bacterium]
MPHPAPSPVVVAHQAGNDLGLLAEALEQGITAVEVDVYLHRGVVEVRHDRRVPGLPLLWRGWLRFARLGGPFHTLRDVLAATPRETLLLIDIKGGGPVGPAVAEVLAADGPRRTAVCGRVWRHLEPFLGNDDIPALFSVGNDRELQRLWSNGPVEGVSIRHTLLDADLLARLEREAGPVWCWTVNDPDRAVELRGLGVTGIISDRPDAIARVVPG